MLHDRVMAVLTVLHLTDSNDHVARCEPGYDP
jgi:hypothetical protein